MACWWWWWCETPVNFVVKAVIVILTLSLWSVIRMLFFPLSLSRCPKGKLIMRTVSFLVKIFSFFAVLRKWMWINRVVRDRRNDNNSHERVECFWEMWRKCWLHSRVMKVIMLKVRKKLSRNFVQIILSPKNDMTRGSHRYCSGYSWYPWDLRKINVVFFYTLQRTTEDSSKQTHVIYEFNGRSNIGTA